VSRRLAPTRSNLQALARRRSRVRRGVALLRRKREVLVRELLDIARPALEARDELSRRARDAWDALLAALTVHSEAELQALALPERDLHVEMEVTNAWGIEIPWFGTPPHVVRTLEMREQAAATAGPSAEQAQTAFEHLVEQIVRVAPDELRLDRLGRHLARTTRQLNMLEQRLAPRLDAQHATMRRVLEERERDDHVRLRTLRRHAPGQPDRMPPSTT